MILPLNSSLARLNNAGGKAANLSKLIQAGFPIPPGFIITTAGYWEFVGANHLEDKIHDLISKVDLENTAGLNQTSTEIRAMFSASSLGQEIINQIINAYQDLNESPVAVRSSATAEDLPGFSFAGQQDTYLNIIGEQELLNAVVNCWSSLWTTRAIGYRSRNNIPHTEVAQAVVVQEMLPCEVSGVLFTANPLTGSRSETVIDATIGLGEALVSGQVEPDHFVVDMKQQKVITRKLGSKSIVMFPKEGGGLGTRANDANQQPAIQDETILELTELGRQVTEFFTFPQDIEWGIFEGRIFLLQSRPITSLFPLPEGMSSSPLQVLFSFGAVQGMLEPMTPLGQDAIRLIFAGGASLFGFDLDQETQPVIKIAGERLWGLVTPIIQNPIGARLIPRVFSAIDPSLQNILAALHNDPEFQFGEGNLRWSTIRCLAAFAGPFLKRVFHYARKPQGAAEQVQQASEKEIAELRKKYDVNPNNHNNLPDPINLFGEIYNAFPYAVPNIASAAAGGLIPFFLLNKISENLSGSNELSLKVTRGLKYNVTTEMDLDLWRTAREIRSDPSAFQHMLNINSRELARAYLEGQLPESAQNAIAHFLEKYGVRGLGEIDIGRRRWREDPTYIIEVIISYMQLDDTALAPDVIFHRGEQLAQEAIVELQSTARATFAGGLKSRLIGMLALRVRCLAGLRESPKFHIIQMMGIIRQGLLKSGQALVKEGVIDQAEDLFYLYYAEIEQLANNEDRDWRVLIDQRRASYQRELIRVQIPRLLISDGRTYYEGLTSEENQTGKLIGSPVSPGLVEGIIRVVLDPLNPSLQPGEIMVCPGTDPAWTPLFLTAGGLIMEVGGMMTHGAIVAREYGIPAVVGVDRATHVLQTGQKIQLNGTTGEILLMDQD